jgi:hypothetical protein
MKTWAHELNKEFSKEEVAMASIHEEVFNFHSYKRDANQNHTKISSHLTVRVAIFKGNNSNKCWQ